MSSQEVQPAETGGEQGGLSVRAGHYDLPQFHSNSDDV